LNQDLVRNISKLGRRYFKDYLAKKTPRPSSLRKHWWKSYNFLAGVIFYQGRSNSLSTIIKDLAKNSIQDYFDTKSSSGITNASDDDITEARFAFQNSEINGKTYKRLTDVEMLFGVMDKKGIITKKGVIHILRDIPKGNIIDYSIRSIIQGNVSSLYDKFHSVKSIAHKITSMYLRDLVDLFYDEVGKSAEIRTRVGQSYLQPIDVWVRRVSGKAGIIVTGSKPLSQAQTIVDACRQVSRSRRFALRYNQGAWWLGEHSLDLALEYLAE